MTAPSVHAARATRRWRKGAWQPVAVCPCGLEKWADRDGEARRAAALHNQEHAPVDGAACAAVTYPRKFARLYRFGAFCARCNWVGQARTAYDAEMLAVAHNDGRAA